MADVGPVSSFTARSPVVLSGDRMYIDDGAGGDFSLSLAVLNASLTKVGKVTITQPATGSTLTIADGKTLTASNSITIAGTDATVMTFPTTSATIARTDAAQTFTGVQTFVAPILGTPTSITLTNASGSPTLSVVTADRFVVSSSNTNAQTGTSYTLVSTDNGKVVTLSNASAITLTVPASLGAGFACTLVQLGAGQVTVTASSTTINKRVGAKLVGQYSVASLYAYAADTFILGGDLSA